MQSDTGTFALGVLLLACGSLGCTRTLTPQQRTLLESGKGAYKRGDYADTLARMNVFLDQAGRSNAAHEGFYLRGLAKMHLDDRPGAQEDLRQAAARTPDAMLRANALNALGDIAWDVNDMETAALRYRQALRDVSGDRAPADHSFYRLGCVLQRQGKWRDADVQFSRVRSGFPGQEMARRADRRFGSTAWSIQAGAYADHDRAKIRAAELTAARLPTTVEPIYEQNKRTFAVRVGRYQTYSQAVSALPEVRKHAADAFLAPMR